MPDMTDPELITKLLEATQRGKLNWEKTAIPDNFSVSYGGRWTLTVDKTFNDNTDRVEYYVAIANAEGEEVLRISGRQDNALPELFEQARRHALKIDQALSDLMKELADGPEISDEDIPF